MSSSEGNSSSISLKDNPSSGPAVNNSPRPEITKVQSRVHTRNLIQTGSSTQSKTFMYHNEAGSSPRLVAVVPLGGSQVAAPAMVPSAATARSPRNSDLADNELDFLAQQLGLLGERQQRSTTTSRPSILNTSYSSVQTEPPRPSPFMTHEAADGTLEKEQRSISTSLTAAPVSKPPERPRMATDKPSRRRSGILSSIVRTFSLRQKLHHTGQSAEIDEGEKSRPNSLSRKVADHHHEDDMRPSSGSMSPAISSQLHDGEGEGSDRESNGFHHRRGLGQRLFQSMRSFRHQRQPKSANTPRLSTDVGPPPAIAQRPPISAPLECTTPTNPPSEVPLLPEAKQEDDVQNDKASDEDKTPVATQKTFDFKEADLQLPTEIECPSYVPISVSAYGYGGISIYKPPLSVSPRPPLVQEVPPPLPVPSIEPPAIVETLQLPPTEPVEPSSIQEPTNHPEVKHSSRRRRVDRRKVQSVCANDANSLLLPTDTANVRHSLYQPQSPVLRDKALLDAELRRISSSFIVMQVSLVGARHSKHAPFEHTSEPTSPNHTAVLSVPLDPDVCKNADDSQQPDGHGFLRLLGQVETELGEKIEEVQRWLENDKMNTDRMDEDVEGHLFATVGKARLLLQDKFLQFRGLCEENVRQRLDTNTDGEGNHYVTLASDLEGFWDMMQLQVEDVRRMYQKAEEMRQNGWKVLPEANNDLHSPPPSPLKATTNDGKHSSKKKTTKKPNSTRLHMEARQRLKLAKEKAQLAAAVAAASPQQDDMFV